MLKRLFEVLYHFLISLKLAVLTFILLAILTAVGTFVESRYDQEIANTLVYSSFWMSFVMILLALNLTMVLIDRWPWKKRQIPFILAHFGILTLMLGFVFTNHLGVDASLQFNEGESTSLISLPEMEIQLYASYDGERFSLLYQKDVDFFRIKPSKEKPFVIGVDSQRFQVQQYFPYAIGNQKLKPIEKGGAPALRFHLSGSRANVVEWMEMELGSKKLQKKYGPAQITMTLDPTYKASVKNELVLYVEGEQLFYSLGQAQRTALKVGDSFPTGWMDFEFRLLEFYPKAQKEFVFTQRKKNSDKTVKALLVEHEGESVWLGQNSHIKFFKKDKVYALSYLNKTKKLNFNLKLLDFTMKKYQGSDKAKNYESYVEIQDSRFMPSTRVGKATGRTAGTTAGNNRVGKATGSTAGSTTGNTTGGKTAGNTAGNTGGKTTEKVAGQTAGSTTGNTAGKTTGQTTGSATGNTAGKTAGQTAGSTAGNTAEKATGNTTKNTAGNTTENTTEKVAGQTAGSTAENTAGNTVEKTAGQTAGSTAGNTGGKTARISMNEPLKYESWTFYQASFEAPETPEDSYRSILSVNYDPGRSLKYIGSLWIVLGVILLFYRRWLFKKR